MSICSYFESSFLKKAMFNYHDDFYYRFILFNDNFLYKPVLVEVFC